ECCVQQRHIFSLNLLFLDSRLLMRPTTLFRFAPFAPPAAMRNAEFAVERADLVQLQWPDDIDDTDIFWGGRDDGVSINLAVSLFQVDFVGGAVAATNLNNSYPTGRAQLCADGFDIVGRVLALALELVASDIHALQL